MAEEGTAGQTEGERNIQAMETRMCGLGRTQGYCSDVQRWDQESQCTGILNMMRDMKNNVSLETLVRRDWQRKVHPL